MVYNRGQITVHINNSVLLYKEGDIKKWQAYSMRRNIYWSAPVR
jgi:hypothetical protein